MASNRFQAIAWEGVDIKSSAQEFYTSISSFERGDLIVENLYDGEANFVKATRGTAQQRMRATSERVDVFAVRVAGRRLDGETAFVELRGFRPYFYVHVESVPAYRLLVDALLEDYRFKHISIDLVDKIPFVGYHARPEKYLRFDCNSKSVFGNIKRFLKGAHDNLACLQGERLTLYESMCDPVVQYHIANRIHPMTWMETDLAVGNVFDTKDVRFFPTCVDSAPFKCIHYDLECFSSVAWSCGKNQMPNPNLDPDVIIGIGAVVSTTNGSAPEERFYFGINPLKIDDASFEDARVFAYDSEAEMLVGFSTWLTEADPDIWNAFNNFGFDDNFLVKRMQRYLYEGSRFVANDVPEFRTLRQRGLKDLFETYFPNRNKIYFGGCEQLRTALKQKTFMSSAFQFEANYLHMPLRVYSDLLIFARREWKSKMNKFSLENVSRVLLGKGKHDVSPRDIFEAWAESSEPKLTTVGAYCIQDCALVAELMASQKIYSSILSRAELFLCDPRDLMLKGQQQIVFNLIYNQVRTQTNFCIPDSVDEAMDDFVVRDDSDDSDDDSGSESEDEPEEPVRASAGAGGAPVNAFARLRSPTAKDMKAPPPPKKKASARVVDGDDDFVPKKKAPVKIKFKGATVLEPKRAPYAYMAPISGLDFASLYPSIMCAYNLCHSTRVLNEADVADISDRENPLVIYTTELTGGRSTTFVQKSVRMGVLPQILLNLWAMRKQIKKWQAKASDEGDGFLEGVFETKQLAVKVAMNSIYGFCGADNGKLPMKDIAETVTSNGRMLIERSKNYAESWYPCEVVYGDTDSIYVRFFLDELPEHLRDPKNETDRNEMMRWVFARSQECADRITENYINPIELEFEKVMYPFILFKKKRYCSLIFEKPTEIKKLDKKGIAPTRRDFAPFVKRVYERILKYILYERDVNSAFEYAEREMTELLHGRYPVEDLVVSRSISRKPDSYANQNVPHLVLGRRMEDRTGVPMQVGDRIAFVFVKGTGRQCDLVEEPHLVSQEQADGNYYYQHQIRSSLAEILGTMDMPRWKALDGYLSRTGVNVARGQKEITSFFTRK
jgi:DNA polymerase elongation subunit (family B)